jgi:ribosomal protein L34E
MATIHKCDKCGKAIKGEQINLAFSDMAKRFFERGYNSYDFCEACAKPLAIYLKGFLNINKK